jgi:two-component system, OmpR family, alkaline phosphatase synthesis response regulator PhoP
LLNIRKSRILHNGQPVNLTWLEYQLFRYLMEHEGVTVLRNELLQQVWGHPPDALTRTVDMHIASLRQKVEGQPKSPEMIITVPLIGYKFQMYVG